MTTPPPLPDQSDPQPKKIVGCLGAFLIVAGLFVLAIVLSTFSSPSGQSGFQSSSPLPAANTAVSALGTSPASQGDPVAKLDYTFDDIDGYGATPEQIDSRRHKMQGYSQKLTNAVYKIASTQPEVTKIVIRVNCRFQETSVEDHYGHEHTRPTETVFAKEIVVDDVADVRRYTERSYKEHDPFFSELWEALVRADRQSPWNPPMPEN